MRLGRAADALAARCAGLYALLRALPAMARVIVHGPEILKAVIVSGPYMVDGIGAKLAAEIARGAVGGEDQRPDRGLPAGGQPVDALRAGPASGTGHRRPPVRYLASSCGRCPHVYNWHSGRACLAFVGPAQRCWCPGFEDITTEREPRNR